MIQPKIIQRLKDEIEIFYFSKEENGKNIISLKNKNINYFIIICPFSTWIKDESKEPITVEMQLGDALIARIQTKRLSFCVVLGSLICLNGTTFFRLWGRHNKTWTATSLEGLGEAPISYLWGLLLENLLFIYHVKLFIIK